LARTGGIGSANDSMPRCLLFIMYVALLVDV
jgi:hypothetical protein